MNVGLVSVEAQIGVRAQQSEDGAAIERLVSAAFGPGRRAKSAERVRESAEAALAHSGIACARGGAVLGVCRMWHLRSGGHNALFLGPLAVAESHRGQGIGAALITWCVAQSAGAAILTIGNLGFFGRWQFVRAEGVALDVPVRAERLLQRPGALLERIQEKWSPVFRPNAL